MNKINHLNEIPSKNYEGYLWFSDSNNPIILSGETYPFDQVNTNPFIIEGLLYCAEDEVSLTIKHTGDYHISICNLKQLPEEAALKEIKYLPHRLSGVNKVCFKQLWLAQPDPCCADMKVLTMKALLFTGFKR